jgi:hypothetical protein
MGQLLDSPPGMQDYSLGANNIVASGSGVVQMAPNVRHGLFAVGIYGSNPTTAMSINNWTRAGAASYGGGAATIFWEPNFTGGVGITANITFIEIGYATGF